MATLPVQYYDNEAAATSNGKTNFFLTDADMFVMQIAYEGTDGVETESSNDITFTPTVSRTFGTDTYNSTVAHNLVVTGDSSTLFYGPLKDNTDTTLVFDATTMFNVADGTAGAASNWTPATSYSWRVMYPSSVTGALYGDHFGHVKDMELTVNEEVVTFTRGVPREKIVQDLVEMQYSMTANHFNPNLNVFKSVLNGVAYGSQTSQTEAHFGFQPAARPQYQVTLVGQNRQGFNMIWQFFVCQFSANGGINFSQEEYKALPFKIDMFKDPLRGNARNAFRLIIDS